MKMPLGNAQNVFLEFFEQTVLPAANAAGGVKPFLLGLGGGLIARRIPEIATQYSPMLHALGILDDEGKINIDLLFEEAGKAIDKTPLLIAGYRFDRGDLEKMKTIAEKYGG